MEMLYKVFIQQLHTLISPVCGPSALNDTTIQWANLTDSREALQLLYVQMRLY